MVPTLVDADQLATHSAILAFGRELRGGDSVEVFYYAGHGVQVHGWNYLISVGGDVTEAGEVPLRWISLTELLRTMKGERAASTSRFSMRAAIIAITHGPVQLHAVLRPYSQRRAYSSRLRRGPAKWPSTEMDPNRPYSGAPAANVLQEGIRLEETFRRTRRQVLRITGNRQAPWEHFSLTGEFFFRPKIARPSSPSGSCRAGTRGRASGIGLLL